MTERTSESIHFDLGITTGPHGISVVPGLKTLHESIQDNAVPKLEDKGGLPGEEGITVLIFFTLAQAAIEHRSIELLYYNIIDDEFLSNSSREFLRENLNQKQREDLLLRTGTIPGHLHSYMSTARTARNEIVHHPHRHILPEFGDFPDITRQTMDAVTELEEMMVDIHLPEDLK